MERCEFGPEEWCGAFIGRQHCTVHGGYRDYPGEYCNRAPLDTSFNSSIQK